MVKGVKKLELLLEEVPDFRNPLRSLEQYSTPSRIAAHLLWNAYMEGRISRKNVVDLGCGTGKLAYGALLLEASSIYCVDIDRDALSTAKEFIREKQCELNSGSIAEFILADVRSGLPLRSLDDCTVVMNPPFGIWSRGADFEFLKESLGICQYVYSIHKASRGFLEKLGSLRTALPYLKYEVLLQDDMELKMSMPNHRKKIHRVRIVVIRLNNS